MRGHGGHSMRIWCRCLLKTCRGHNHSGQVGVIGLVQQAGALQPTSFGLNMLVVGTEAMVAHMVKLQEVSITVRTLIALSSVPSYVRFQVIALAETLVALIALVGTLACMGAHMYGQIVGAMEALAARVAQVGFCARVIAANMAYKLQN